MSYGGGSEYKTQDVGTDPVVDLDPTVEFTVTKVTLEYPGTIKYYASGWKTFTKPTMYMLPGTYSFVFGSGAPGGTPQWVTVTAGVVTNID